MEGCANKREADKDLKTNIPSSVEDPSVGHDRGTATFPSGAYSLISFVATLPNVLIMDLNLCLFGGTGCLHLWK